MEKLVVFCETLKNPLGIANPKPRFSWRMEGAVVCSPQQKYQIRVYDKDNCVWDSGVRFDCKSIAVLYEGKALKSFTSYRYEVACTLVNGAHYIAEGSFETAILSENEWKGCFLAYPKYQKRQSPVFVSDMKLNGKIKCCRAYFCGLGYGELYINGHKTDNSVLDPGWTDYTQRVLYRTFDITDWVEEGTNRIRVLLADGWMAHNHRYFRPKPPLPWYHEPCFWLNIRITYEDGKIETFVPDLNNCRVNTSEILSQNVFDGEEYSAVRAEELAQMEAEPLREEDGWIAPCVTEIGGTPHAQIMPPICETEIIKPIRVASIDASTYVVDMGINFSGYARITLLGERESSVQMRYSELANEDDTINQVNLRFAQCCDTYHVLGKEQEVWSPRFTYRGYRFLEIKISGKVQILDVVGVRVNTAMERIGEFSCDNDLINRIYRMLINTEMNNVHSVPTDCPQRDERLGWMNDNTMRLEQLFMNFDSQLFYEKWFHDILDLQKKLNTGAVADSCPYYYGMSPARWNTSVFITLPYFTYRYFGDDQLFRQHWDQILWYMQYQKSKIKENGLFDDYFVGEWCPPLSESILTDSQSAFAKNIRNQLATGCFYIMECLLCCKMAALMEDTKSVEMFKSSIEQMKNAINAQFFDYEKGCYIPKCQGNQIFPLFLKITPNGYEKQVEQALLSCINDDSYHITTGSHMTRFLFEVLDLLDANDAAVRMLNIKTYPSFGYMIENGATSLWERWEKNLGFMTSHDHPMTGGFGVWFFKSLGGLRLGTNEDGEVFQIRPSVPNGLQYVNCHRKFRNGDLLSNWRRVGSEIHFDIQVPWNTPTEILIPKLGRRVCDVLVNGRAATEEMQFAETETHFTWKVNSGYWHIELRTPKTERI